MLNIDVNEHTSRLLYIDELEARLENAERDKARTLDVLHALMEVAFEGPSVPKGSHEGETLSAWRDRVEREAREYLAQLEGKPTHWVCMRRDYWDAERPPVVSQPLVEARANALSAALKALYPTYSVWVEPIAP